MKNSILFVMLCFFAEASFAEDIEVEADLIGTVVGDADCQCYQSSGGQIEML